MRALEPCALVGTAGWSIPAALAPDFPSAGPQLERYARAMPTTEINTSFYRRHRRSTYERWASSTPEHFRFSLKLPREISHTRKLIDSGEPLDLFIEQIGGLGRKLAVVLVQLPPSLMFEQVAVAEFFAMLRARLDPAVAIATEPRHPSWFSADVDSYLADNLICRVAADPVLAPGCERPGGWTGLIYRRLHGSPRVYYSAYDQQRLATLAQTIALEQADGTKSWCIFDNTASGAALANALQLRTMLRS